MKKFLISSILFSSIFLFNSNIKAISNKTVTAYYDGSFFEQHFLSDSYVDFLDNQLIPYLDSTLGNNYAYVIYVLPDYFTNNFQSKTRISVSPKGSGNFGMVVNSNSRTIYSRYYTTFPTDYHGGSTSFMYKTLFVTSSDYMTQINNFNSNPTWTQTNTYISDVFSNFSSFTNNNASYLTSIGNEFLLYYSNVDYKFATGGSDYDYFANFIVNYDGNTTTYTLGDSFPFYKNFITPTASVNKVIDLGDNSFGFYQDYVGLNLSSLSGATDTLSVVCEQDRPFNNNYCFINYNDLINHNSDITVFNDYGVSFTQLFGSNTGYLLNDRYYLYSFRIQKPFVPQVGNLFINSLTNNSNQVDILGVYLQDGGSYTDYVIKFKISNSDYSSSTSLNDITVVFRDGLSSYFSSIPTSFNYSVYRSFKLQYFSTEPTMEQVNSFYNSNDLSSIDGVGSNNSFFTDNDFNTFGFAGIVTAPFRFLYAIENYQSCSNIILPFPHSNDTVTLACVRNSIPSSINPLISILQIILSGFISYRIAVETLSIIKDISSPDVANIEVVDL